MTMPPMHASDSILRLVPSDPRWMSFLDANTDINIFYHPVWMQLMAECYGYRSCVLALAGNEGELAAGIPLMEVSPINGRRWVSLPFSDYCHPLSKDESALKVFTDQILRSAESEKIPILDLRGMYPAHPSLHSYSNHVIHKLDLAPGSNAVWERVHAMHRRNVRIAKENDVEIVFGDKAEHMAEFYRLHLLTRRRQGVPIQPWKFFMHLKKLLLDQGCGFILLAYKNQRCIAGAIFLHWKDTLTYKYGASTEDSLNYRPNNLIMWTAIQRACEQGFRYFDMGRTDLGNKGLRMFKSRWGAVEIPLVYSSSKTNPNHAVEGRLARYMHFVIQKSPAWVCRFSGELLYRHFG
jgi:CelD/BcsL family acetyltransferase involved in cellulose biosynthesis